MSGYDDEDWLYRRGSYSGDPRRDPVAPAERPSAGPPQPAGTAAPSAAPSAAAPSAAAPSAHPDAEYGQPTPVGHYGASTAGAEPPRDFSVDRDLYVDGARGRRSTPPPGPLGPPVQPAPPASGSTARRPRSRRRGRRVGVTILVLALVYLLGIPLLTWPFLTRVDAAPDGARPAGVRGQLFLLAGSDARDDMTTEEQNRLNTGSDAGRRTDTIMLMYVPPTGKAALVSVPRDSYLAIPGHGRNKVNAAYSIGGPELLVATVEQATGLRIDGYAEVGFGGFVHVVDAVGGIEMCPATAISDRDSSLDIPAGCQLMDGVTALGYVRMRKADPRGDLGRAERQREMVSALASKVVSPLTVLLPWRWWGVNSSLARSIRLGADVGPLAFLGMAWGAARIGTGGGMTLVVPVANANATTPAGSSVLWNDDEAAAMFEAMARGDTAALERFAQ